MDPTSKLFPGSPGLESPTWTEEDVSKQREARSTSKAERILGVSDTFGSTAQKKGGLMAGAGKKLRRKASNISFTFTDLRGTLSPSRQNGSGHYSPNGKHSPRTPGFGPNLGPNDCDSRTSTPSLRSPIFDPTGSTSTLPSVYDSPLTPHYATRHNFIFPSTSKTDFENSGGKATRVLKSPTIENSEETGYSRASRSNWHDLPSLDLPPLSPQSTSSKGRPFSQISWRKSSSNTSANSENTIRSKWLGRKGSNQQEKDKEIVDSKSSRAHNPPPVILPRLYMPKSGKHVQEWLDRADLERRPSVATTTRQSIPASVLGENALSPHSSTTSVKTLTTQSEVPNSPRDTQVHWPLPATIYEGSSSSPAKSNKSDRMVTANLSLESVLTLSSSDSESDGDTLFGYRSSRQRGDDGRWRDGSMQSQSSHARNVSNASTIVSSSPVTSDSDRVAPLRIYKPATVNKTPSQLPKRSLADLTVASSRKHFFPADWQLNDETELGNICLAAAEKGYSSKSDVTPVPALPTLPTKSRLDRLSSINAPSETSSKLSSLQKEAQKPSDVSSLGPSTPKKGQTTPATSPSPETAARRANFSIKMQNARRKQHEELIPRDASKATNSGSKFASVLKPVDPHGAQANETATHEAARQSLVHAVDVTSFPKPPPSRSSAIPTIQVQSASDPSSSRDSTPRPRIPSAGSKFAALSLPPPPAQPASPSPSSSPPPVLLAPSSSLNSRANSVSSTASSSGGSFATASSSASVSAAVAHHESVAPHEPYGSDARVAEVKGKTDIKVMLTRKRTISNVPIYVTGLENSGDGDDLEGEESVATFVFSNMV